METSNDDPSSLDDEATRLDTLPPEVLEVVFSYLPRADLATVLGVNTRLLTTAYPILYKHLWLGASLPSFRPGVRGLNPLNYIHSIHVSQHDPSECASLPSLPSSSSSSCSTSILSLPSSSHPNIRDICPLTHLGFSTLIIRHAPLLYHRVTYSFHSLTIPRAIIAFSPDSAIVGSNFKFEISPDGPNGFLRRIPNAQTVVWVFAAKCWRPSPRPWNTLSGSYSSSSSSEESLGGGGGGGVGEEKKEEKKKEKEEKKKELAYLSTTWVGRLFSPAVFEELRRRCPALRRLSIVNVEALDPVAVVQHGNKVGPVVKRWIRRAVRKMEGWEYGEDGGGEEGHGMGGGLDVQEKVIVQCLALDEFINEEMERGTDRVRRDEVDSWFE